MRRLLPRRAIVVLAIGLLAATGCSDDAPSATGDTKDEAVALLTDAKKTLDETASVHVTIAGRDLPDGAQALQKADGVATHAPAFKGTLTVRTAGTSLEAQVIAVGNKVYAKPSFSPKFLEFSPAQLKALGAPDPALLLDPARGITSILPALADPAVKGESRQGSAVLTEVTGTIKGSTLTAIFPGAPADSAFPVTFKIDKSAKRLVTATISGPFYGEQTSSYDVTLDRYGETVEITKP